MLPPSLTLLLLSSISTFPLVPAIQIPLQTPPVPRFPWIHKFASIGDSYSSGLGSGSRLDWSCSRYASSYPHILHTSLLGADAARSHQFLACSGASTSMILSDQIPKLEQGVDLLTISAGGNDIGLTPVLSSCVYQFYMSGEEECGTAIQKAQAAIEDPLLLHKNVAELIDAAKPKMSKDGVIVLTGYARFFGAEDEICDKVSWAVWSAVEFKKQYLSLAMREQLNELVLAVNRVLKNVTETAGPNTVFVDYDSEIVERRGRYCERGVHEPSPNRHALAFYEWNTVDAGENGTELQDHTGDDVPKGSFESGIAERINRTLVEHPEWRFDPDKGFVDRGRGEVEEEGIIGGIGDAVHWMIPDSWKRVFHLRPEGHGVVARLVVDALAELQTGREDGELNEL
ncbi:SGNH hydrolase [Melanomma pulvis-pyrius CBS 109.77]|uniref:SGNH hydrolase n=1 Tax=Melanomma pulvis-pyrius CBS 109.77 TaxID=1314802 RepID=A0A6A6X1B3_9PLEO|nr:SGNH hydrolase [Melanomma pulvis-pyrius CBS 109.77]